MVTKKEQQAVLEMIKASLSKEDADKITKIEKQAKEREERLKEERKRRRKLFNNEVVECELCGEKVTRRNLKRHYSSANCRCRKENNELKRKIKALEKQLEELQGKAVKKQEE